MYLDHKITKKPIWMKMMVIMIVDNQIKLTRIITDDLSSECFPPGSYGGIEKNPSKIISSPCKLPFLCSVFLSENIHSKD